MAFSNRSSTGLKFYCPTIFVKNIEIILKRSYTYIAGENIVTSRKERKEFIMRVSFSTNAISCQPLRNFGKAEHSQKNNSASSPAFSSSTVSKEDYDKLNAKYEMACRIAVAQADQYNKLVASCKKH